MEDHQKPHFLLLSLPTQGHINPTLQFAKQLLQDGAQVTLATTTSGHDCIDKSTLPTSLVLAAFSDGPQNQQSIGVVQSQEESLAELFDKSSAEGTPFTYLVHTNLLTWSVEVARKFNVPSILLWIQAATVFDIYYYYFNGYREFVQDCEKDPSWSLELPNIPLKLKACDLPSYLLPSLPYPYTRALPRFQQQIEELEKEEKPMILVNTFEALEEHSLGSISNVQLIPVGPLLPSAFLDGGDVSDRSFGGDLFEGSKEEDDYIKWLDGQEKPASVIYVSFGSFWGLSKVQMEEVAQALVQTHRPFIWVIRKIEKGNQLQDDKGDGDPREYLSCMKELKEQGLIVPWCSQVEVLSHRSVGCFVTHCGWNSTLESLSTGVPMVAFPQSSDQKTNAKLVEDMWKIGVRVKVSEEGGLVMNEEIKRCLKLVMESDEMKQNAKKLRDLAIEAAKESGSSRRNLKDFYGGIDFPAHLLQGHHRYDFVDKNEDKTVLNYSI